MSRIFHIEQGLRPGLKLDAARLYWAAFSQKLGKILGPQRLGIAYFSDAIVSENCFCAVGETGDLLGVAGFKVGNAGFLGGGIGALRRCYGLHGVIWRLPALMMLEKSARSDTLQMDGICVAQGARGAGIGSALLRAMASHGRNLGKDKVSLDVIDTNPRARALYQRHGFTATSTVQMGPLRYIYGFSAATKMDLDLEK